VFPTITPPVLTPVARPDSNPVLAGEILIDALENLAHLECCPYGAQCIVFMDGRHTTVPVGSSLVRISAKELHAVDELVKRPL
jgi:hypothetical protein